MRILHVTSHLQQGGIPRSVLALAKGMVERGHQVVVAADSGSLEKELVDAGAVVWMSDLHTSAEFSPRVWKSGRCLAKRLKQAGVDVLHAHTRVGQVVAHRLSRTLKIPYVTTWHGYYRPNIGRRFLPCTGDRTLAISQPVADHLQSTFKVNPQRIVLVPHGIELDTFSPGRTSERHAFRAKLGIAENDFIAGTVSRLVASKGVDVFVRCADQLFDAADRAHVVIVGEGASLPQLRVLAAKTKRPERIHFVDSLPSHAVYPALDAFVFLPTDREGFGLTLLEALACCVPTVAIRRGPGAEWLIDSLQGVSTVAPDDPAALAAALALIQREPQAAQAAAQSLRRQVESGYSFDGMIDTVERVYKELVAA